MKSLILLFLILSASHYCFAADISLLESDLAKLVSENNALVKASHQSVNSFEAKTGHLRRSFLPKASLLAGQESFRYVADEFDTQPYYGANLKVTLYNGGRDSITGQINDVEFQKSKSDQKVTLFGQLEEARRAFWRAVYLESLVKEYDVALDMVERNKKQALKRIRGGVATQSDRYEFDIKETELKQDKKRTILGLNKTLGYLKVLIGAQKEDQILLKQKLVHDHGWRKYLDHSEDEHSYLVNPQKLGLKISQLQVEKSARAWLPSLDAYAFWMQFNQRMDYDRIDDKDRQQAAIGLKATWNFSDLISGQVEKESNHFLTKSKELKLEYFKKNLENELHLEIKELELLDSMVHEADENIVKAQKFFDLISREYRRGVKTSGDMLLATEKLMAIKVRKMDIIRDFHIAKVHIMGKLGE